MLKLSSDDIMFFCRGDHHRCAMRHCCKRHTELTSSVPDSSIMDTCNQDTRDMFLSVRED